MPPILLTTCISFLVSAWNPWPIGEKAPSRIALLVTISQYEENSGWNTLHADRDADLIEYALIREGFKKENILVLRDADATRQGIMEAVETHLVQKATKGGLAVFLFSGHGQQVRDNNDDELDKLDEAIVPYDSPLHFKKGGYEGERLIRDDELGSLLDKVRKKLGKTGHLLALLDSCHSGTGTRGRGSARGTDVIMADSSFISKLELQKEKTKSPSWGLSPVDENLAPMVVFSGAGAHQLNYEMQSPEGDIVGSLSYAFSQALTGSDPEESYQSLFDRIRLLMGGWVPRQQPQAEGALQLQIFGGQMLPQKKYFRIPPTGVLSEKRVNLEAGQLNGLFAGTLVGFYPPHTFDQTQTRPLATGVVTQADLMQCEIELDHPLASDSVLASWIYVTEQHYGDLGVQIQLTLGPGALKNALLEQIAAFPIITPSERDGELIIEETGDSGNIRVISRDGAICYASQPGQRPDLAANQLVRYLLRYIQARFLRTLEMEDPSMLVQCALVPEKTEKSPEPGVCRVGDVYRLEIVNRGELPAFYNILDIQPDNQVNPLVPAAGSLRTPEEYYIRPGETQVFELPLEIGPPAGTEVLKVIATDEPIDLRSIVEGRGQSKGRLHPFEQLLTNTSWAEYRGGGALVLFPELNIFTLVFEIKED